MAVKVYASDPLPQIPLVPWLMRDSAGELPHTLKGVPNPFVKVEWVRDLESSDCALVPNNLGELTSDEQRALSRMVERAIHAGKKIFLFSCGDFTDQYRFDSRAYVFRYSVYRHTLTPQDIVMLTMVNDYGSERGVHLREKTQIPVVSFCGQAGYHTLRQWVGYYLKTGLIRLRSVISPTAPARLIGVYWRRRLIHACMRSSRVVSRFIIRHSFSAAMRTIELDPAQARKEFIESIEESDVVLAPKGDGNYSNRFLETLSLGRIPVLLDTDVVLPFEEELEYEQCVVRIPMQEVNQTPELIRAWYDAHTQETWAAAQQRAREVFETRLRFDAFFDRFFSVVLPTLPTDARERTI